MRARFYEIKLTIPPLSAMQIPVNDAIYLDEFTLDDKFDLTNHLNDRAVSDTMLTIPFPYTLQDAENWIYFTLKQRTSGKQPQNFAIKETTTGKVIGGIGLTIREESYYHHQAEIGYWITTKYWNRGFATAALAAFVPLAFELFPFLKKLTAVVYINNYGSQKVVENNSFKEEGLLKQHIFKFDQYLDCKTYGLLKEELKYSENI